MLFCRINLEETNYKTIDFKVLKNFDYNLLDQIYTEYCRYKKFESVMPLFFSELTANNTDILGYFDNDKLVAFSYVKKYDNINAEAVQFAWDYRNPRLRLGIRSLESECAYYKSLGFKYYYLGSPDAYKKTIKGFEILGAR